MEKNQTVLVLGLLGAAICAVVILGFFAFQKASDVYAPQQLQIEEEQEAAYPASEKIESESSEAVE